MLCTGPRMWSFTAPSDVRGAACFISSCCPTVLSWLFKEFVLMCPVLVSGVYNSSSLPHRDTFNWLILCEGDLQQHVGAFLRRICVVFIFLVAPELAPTRGFCLLRDTHEADASHSAALSCDAQPSKYSGKSVIWSFNYQLSSICSNNSSCWWIIQGLKEDFFTLCLNLAGVIVHGCD